MAAGKLSPRQRMINLMYLVFIAMLAMQIDQQVLRSFQGINESLVSTSNLSKESNIVYYEDLEKKAVKDSVTYQKKNKTAKEIKAETSKILAEIQSLKNQLKSSEKSAEGEEVNYNVLKNTDRIVELFFQGKGFKNEKTGNETAQKFVKDLNTYVEKLKTFSINKKSSNLIDSTFDYLKYKKNNKTWLSKTFYDQPLVAAKTNFSKVESDIRAIEGNLVRELLAVKLEDIVFDEYKAIPKSPCDLIDAQR